MIKNYELCIQYLKNKNYRLTNVRMEILKLFFQNNHLTFNDIKKQLAENHVANISSIYNTLEILLKEDIILSYNFNKEIYYELEDVFAYHIVLEDELKNTDFDSIKLKEINGANELKNKIIKNCFSHISPDDYDISHIKLEVHVKNKCKK